MNLGDLVELHSHDGFIRFVDIVGIGIPDTFVGQKPCYRIPENDLFYMEPELGTGKYYKVGDRTFWIMRP
jgi:hypothetical protein